MSLHTGHLVLFGGGLVLAGGCLFWTVRNSEKAATTEFAVFLSIIVVWISLQVVEVVATPTWDYYASFAIRAVRALMALSWFYFTMTYAGYGDVVRSTAVRSFVGAGTGYLFVVTGIPPVATALTFPTVETISEPFTTVFLTGTTPFRLASQVTGYSLVTVGSLGLAYRFVKTGYTTWWRPAVFLGSVIAVVFLDLVIENYVPPVPGVDYAAIGAAAASVVLILVLYRHDLLGSIPIGRDHLFRTLQDPVFILDAGRTVVDLNGAAQAIVPEGNGRGEQFETVLPDTTSASDLLTASDGATTVAIDTEEGTQWYEASVSEMAPVGESAGVVVVFRDISALKERTHQLEERNERLETFASVVSHDLRNPLHVAQSRVELAQEDCESAHLRKVAEAHERMETLIDDVLRLATQGADVAEMHPVGLTEICEECWDTVATEQATLVVDADGSVAADRTQLKRLIENLLQNAIEHGGDSVTVAVGTTDGGFYIADDGPGVSDAMGEEIFELGRSGSEDGTGLGLHIVKNIADAHGWEIETRTSESGGARFDISGVRFVNQHSGTDQNVS